MGKSVIDTVLLSEGSPCRRLYASFLLLMVRDCVPSLKTRYINNTLYTEYIRYPRNLLEMEMRTLVFEIACEACEIDPSHVRTYLRKVQSMEASQYDYEWHLRAYPKGGTSSVIVIGSSGGTQ